MGSTTQAPRGAAILFKGRGTLVVETMSAEAVSDQHLNKYLIDFRMRLQVLLMGRGMARGQGLVLLLLLLLVVLAILVAGAAATAAVVILADWGSGLG
jgi:hypothetical protein